MTGAAIPRPTSVSFAKSKEHERFLRNFKGECRGRYPLAYLVAIEFLGGPELRAQIERALGKPSYIPDQMYPGLHIVVIFDMAHRAGLSMPRMGEVQIAAFKRAKPDYFRSEIAAGFAAYGRNHRRETNYGTIRAVLDPEPGRGKIYRVGQPNPCEFFTGVVAGLFKAYGATGTAQEIACQWEGSPECCYDVQWWTTPETAQPGP